MNILLTQRRLRNFDEPANNPIALLDLAPFLRGLGHRVECYYMAELPKEEYDIVGLSILNYDSDAVKDTLFLRDKFKGAKIVVGGKGAMSFSDSDNQFLKENGIEVCRGRGEEYFSNTEYVDYDNYPSWEIGDLKTLHVNNEGVMTARGCPYSCHFCHNTEKRLSFFTAKRTVTNIELLFKTGRKYIVFVDDIFTLKTQHMLDIYYECKKKGIDIEGKNIFLSHINHINEELIRVMALFKPMLVNIGIESGDDDMLKRMGKPFTAEIAYEKLKLLSSYVPVGGLFLIGFPGENIESLNNTLKFIKKVRTFLKDIWVSFYNPVPNTQGYRLAEKNGIIINKKQDNRKIRYIDNNLTKSDLTRYKYLIIATYLNENLFLYRFLSPLKRLKFNLLRFIERRKS